jgi:glutamine synthetase
MTLKDALDALDADASLRDLLTGDFIDVFVTMKRDEVARYEASVDDPDTREVTRWELEEYIEDY